MKLDGKWTRSEVNGRPDHAMYVAGNICSRCKFSEGSISHLTPVNTVALPISA